VEATTKPEYDKNKIEFHASSGESHKIKKMNIAGKIHLHTIALASLIFAVVINFACSESRDGSAETTLQDTSAQSYTGPAFGVTPVRGPSWIKHLGIRDIRDTAMGQDGGSEPPPNSMRSEPPLTVGESRAENNTGMGMGMGMGGMMGRIFSYYRLDQNEVARLMNEKFLLSGSDLYRLNCQSCHGPEGLGKPPEINSLIGPAQGTSQKFIEKRAEKMGHPIGPEMAHELAAEADSALRQRLTNGGKKCHLSGISIALNGLH
jgi:mono/diheme cytochrome c family protein